MKKFFIFLFLLFIFQFLFLGPVFAHVLKTDGDIGAVVHIDPEDDPIVGEKTIIYFDIKDKTGKFKAENCDCVFKVKKAGTEVYTQLLAGTTTSYNFPERNIYTLELHGQPKIEGQFQPFALTYDVRVEREANGEMKTTNDHTQWILLIGGVVVVIVIGYVVYLAKVKKR